MSDITAKRPGFHLKMRLVTSRGEPFRNKFYRVLWANKEYPDPAAKPYQTDRDGAVSALLDHPGEVPAPQGELRVVDVDDRSLSSELGQKPQPKGEIVRWRIPLHIATEPQPTAIPNIDVAPTPPPPAAPIDQVLDYEDQMRKYRGRVLAQLRERCYEFPVLWDVLERVYGPRPIAPQATDPDDHLWTIWQLTCVAYQLYVHGYEAAWRLWNMADLPLGREPDLPMVASDLEQVYHGLGRFAFRHGLGGPLAVPADPVHVAVILDRIRAVHDRREPAEPAPAA